MGIKHDGEEYIQSKNINKHIAVAEELIRKGFAYKCYCSEEEINEQKRSVKNKVSLMFIIESGETLKILRYQTV